MGSFGCRTRGNVDVCNAFFLFLPYPRMLTSRTSGDFENCHALDLYKAQTDVYLNITFHQ